MTLEDVIYMRLSGESNGVGCQTSVLRILEVGFHIVLFEGAKVGKSQVGLNVLALPPLHTVST